MKTPRLLKTNFERYTPRIDRCRKPNTRKSSCRSLCQVNNGRASPRLDNFAVMSQGQAASDRSPQIPRVGISIDELKRLVLKCVATQGHSQTDSETITEVCAFSLMTSSRELHVVSTMAGSKLWCGLHIAFADTSLGTAPWQQSGTPQTPSRSCAPL